MNNPFEIIESRLSNIENLLLDLKHNASDHSNSTNEALLTVKDAAKFLSLSVPTIYSLISKNELPVMKRAKRCYFSKADLLNYVREGKKLQSGKIEAVDFLKPKK